MPTESIPPDLRLTRTTCHSYFGAVEWDPIAHLSRFLENGPSGGARFGVFFIALCFIYVQLILNLSANSIGAGCDMTALLPRWALWGQDGEWVADGWLMRIRAAWDSDSSTSAAGRTWQPLSVSCSARGTSLRAARGESAGHVDISPVLIRRGAVYSFTTYLSAYSVLLSR